MVVSAHIVTQWCTPIRTKTEHFSSNRIMRLSQPFLWLRASQLRSRNRPFIIQSLCYRPSITSQCHSQIATLNPVQHHPKYYEVTGAYITLLIRIVSYMLDVSEAGEDGFIEAFSSTLLNKFQALALGWWFLNWFESATILKLKR